MEKERPADFGKDTSIFLFFYLKVISGIKEVFLQEVYSKYGFEIISKKDENLYTQADFTEN